MDEGGEKGARSDEVNRIDLFFHPYEVGEEEIKGYRTAVVIDVLRTGVSVAKALSNEARDVIPVASMERAFELISQLEREHILLCGERDGKLITGFNLGNSPAEFQREKVRGKTLIFVTSNATPALVRWSPVKTLYLCSLVNLPSVVQSLTKKGEVFPLAVVCAGKNRGFALEDAVCGGMLAERIGQWYGDQLRLNDGARSALILAKELGTDLYLLLRTSDSGQHLIQLGMEEDLNLCASLGVLPVVPIMRDRRLVNEDFRG